MIVTREKKVQQCESIAQSINSFSAVLCVNYSNFPTEEIERLRDECFKNGSKVVFAKNSLISLACAENEREKMKDNLKSSSLLIFSNDIFSLIASAGNFAKSLKKGRPDTKISISCGILDAKFVDNNTIKKLSNIPSLQSLHTNLVSVLYSPLQKLVKICNNPMIDLLKVLDHKSKNC